MQATTPHQVHLYRANLIELVRKCEHKAADEIRSAAWHNDQQIIDGHLRRAARYSALAVYLRGGTFAPDSWLAKSYETEARKIMSGKLANV